MQIRTFKVLVVISLCFVTTAIAQPRNVDIRNGFAIGGGVTQFDIITDNFDTKSKTGYMVLAMATGDLPHKWYNISYFMQLSENNIDISGRMSDDVTGSEQIEYKMFAAQAGLILHVKLVSTNLTLDLGPQIQYNGKLDLKNANQESYFINNYDMLQARDIENISQINVNGMVGATAGFGPFKVRAQYIYGASNILNKLNDQSLEIGDAEKFKGNMSMLAFTAMFTF